MNSYYTLSQPNEDQERTLYSQQIKRMLSQVSTSTASYLDHLSYIYKSNGINFRIKQFHGILMRMLSPFELLSHFGLDDNQQLFQTKNSASRSIRQNVHSNRNRIFRRNQNLQYESITQKSIRSNYNFGQRSNKFQSLAQKIRLAPQSKAEVKSYENSQFQQNQQKKQLRPGRQPILGSQVQEQLCDWIREQVARNKSISHAAITQQARKLSNNRRFLGSSGWFKRFLKRNPQIKKILDMCKNNSMQQTQALDGQVNTLVMRQKDGNHQLEQIQKISKNGRQGDWYGVFYNQSYMQDNQYMPKNSKTVKQQDSNQQNIQFEQIEDYPQELNSQKQYQAKIIKINPKNSQGVKNLKIEKL